MEKNKSTLAPFFFWLFLTTILLTLPGSAFPKENWLNKIWMDKWIHVALFFVLTWLGCRGFQQRDNKRKIFIVVALMCIAYGLGMEFVQKNFVRNRSFDTGDIIADGAGVLTGLIMSWGWYIKK